MSVTMTMLIVRILHQRGVNNLHLHLLKLRRSAKFMIHLTNTDAEAETSHQIWARYVASVMNNHPNKDGVRTFEFRVTRLLEQLEEGTRPYTNANAQCLQSSDTTEKYI